MDDPDVSGPIFDLQLYQDDRFSLLVPSGNAWRFAHVRRTFSCRNVVRSCGETVFSATLYPSVRAGGEYQNSAHYLRRTQRLPTDITIERRRGNPPIAITQYTNRERDRYYALIENRFAFLEIDCTTRCGGTAPPIEEMMASVQFRDPVAPPPQQWECVTLPGLTITVPAGWERKDEYNRRLDLPFVADAHGISVSRTDPVYATRQLSPPQYRVQALAPGRNLPSYLVGLKTERHKSSIDGATYDFLGEDHLRTKQMRGTRLRYQGYSPQGIRGPMEWYHELLLLEIGAIAFLITAYCDWIERRRYQPIFAHMTASLRPQ